MGIVVDLKECGFVDIFRVTITGHNAAHAACEGGRLAILRELKSWGI